MLLAFFTTLENEDDRQTAEDLYRLYGRTMLFVARGILDDHDLAEDAVSEAFVKIMNNLEKINPKDCYKTKGFVVIIARHTALNMLKQQKREKTVSYEDYVDYLGYAEPLYDAFTVKEACAQIADAIAGLHKSYTDILYLKYEMDYSIDEISKLLGISPDNVRMRLSRARKALKKQLGKEDVYSGSAG